MSGAHFSLGNDLDLKVHNETNTFYPIVTTEAGKYDRLNPLEVVVIEHPQPNSTYTVTITNHAMVSSQAYALVILGEGGSGNSAVKYDDNRKKTLGQQDLMYILLGAAGVILLCCVCSCVCRRRNSHAQKSNEDSPQTYAARSHTSASSQTDKVSGKKNKGEQNKSPARRSADMESRTMGDLYGPPPSASRPANDGRIAGDGSQPSHMMQFAAEAGLDRL